ncbi:Immune-associated nucleotide-binding protein 7 [Holothuria leucospilota]|uniref:Immune-associated nucleotide-binding protein 7 n=1 Tax=Holothuria leucospilota TaxID=206669 RepID=A0A9Q1BT77_HOLLE|nr:Immune-associated nucleotide-binding protein 7 [Holothuria leucospilota]
MKEIVQAGGETTNWYLLSGEQGNGKEGKVQLCMKYENAPGDNDDEGMIPFDKITTFLNIGKRSLSDYTGKVPDKVNIILVGRGGNGKSSVGNTLLGRQCFSTREGQNTLQLAKLQKRNFEVNVMDTPDLFDQHHQMETEQQTMEMVKTAMDFPDGIHLFLIVCRGDVRLKDEERKMLAELEKKYDQGVKDHSLLVLTHSNDFLRHKSLEEVLKTNEDLWNVFTYVRGRVIAIENIHERLTDLTIEDQQTHLLRTIFEVIRMQHHKSYGQNIFHTANEQIVQRKREHEGIKQAYDSIFDHVVNTICGKTETDLCEILKTKYFEIDDHILTSIDACPNENIIRQCTEWCIKDLETFINLVLTEKRLKQSSDEGDGRGKSYPLIETYKERSLRTSKLIKLNRQKLMILFNTDVEEKVRSFLRCRELSEINQILTEVENDITQCEIYDAILESLPEYFKSEEWIADAKYLGLQNLHGYLEMKTKVWPYTLP